MKRNLIISLESYWWTKAINWNMALPPCFLVGNKRDLERNVEAINGQEMVEQIPEFIAYFETSLLSGENLEDLISSLENQMKQRV